MKTKATAPMQIPLIPDPRYLQVNGQEFLNQLSASVTITVGDPEAEAAPQGYPVPFQTILAVEGELARDNGPAPRFIPPDLLTWSNLPLPFFAMDEIVGPGHEGQELIGRIDLIERIPVEQFANPAFDVSRVPEGGRIIFGTGAILNDETTDHVRDLMGEDMLRGVSIDLVSANWVLADAETLEPVDEMEITLDDYLAGKYILLLERGEIGGATAAPMQAIGTATIALVASAVDGEHHATIYSNFGVKPLAPEPAAVVAAAPLVRSKSVYFMPEPDEPTPLTLTEDGRVFGHLFVKGSCHVGFQHRCLMPQPSPTNYAHFNIAPVPTVEGEDVLVGQLTMDTDHAAVAPGVTADDVWRHYSDTGCAVADVRLTNGRFGGWVSGALRDVGEATARTLKAAKMSGDWRKKNGRLDLIGVLMVNVPGYEVPQPRAWVTASAAGEEVEAMVAAGIVFEEELEMDDLLADLLDDECAPCEMDVLADELIAA